MIKYRNKRTTLTIDLPEECGHTGYSVDCSYSFDKELYPVKECEIIRSAYYCSHCGVYVEKNQDYCPHCNAELDWNCIEKETKS